MIRASKLVQQLNRHFFWSCRVPKDNAVIKAFIVSDASLSAVDLGHHIHSLFAASLNSPLMAATSSYALHAYFQRHIKKHSNSSSRVCFGY
jgi:hypothetical protein